jgi:hypothetical protein
LKANVEQSEGQRAREAGDERIERHMRKFKPASCQSRARSRDRRARRPIAHSDPEAAELRDAQGEAGENNDQDRLREASMVV